MENCIAALNVAQMYWYEKESSVLDEKKPRTPSLDLGSSETRSAGVRDSQTN